MFVGVFITFYVKKKLILYMDPSISFLPKGKMFYREIYMRMSNATYQWMEML